MTTTVMTPETQPFFQGIDSSHCIHVVMLVKTVNRKVMLAIVSFPGWKDDDDDDDDEEEEEEEEEEDDEDKNDRRR